MPSQPPTRKPVSLPALLGWIAGVVVVLAGAVLVVMTMFSRPAPSPAETPAANGAMPETWAPAAPPAGKAPAARPTPAGK
jgi:hypothetical protein